MTRPVVLAVLVMALAAPIQAQANRDALVRQLDSLAGAPVQEGRAAGIAVAVVRGRDTMLLKGYGKANLEWNVPTPPDAVYEIGSVTKQFTAAAILQLRDEGKLNLDDDLTKYVPDFPTGGRTVTLRRLMDHTSGIKGLTEIPEFGRLVTSNFPRDSALALIKRQPFEFEPGEAMIYNNSAYWLLGLVIERASGMSYEDYVEQKIFAPLGMRRSMYCHLNEVVERRAFGYQYPPNSREPRRAALNVHTWPYSAGSLCSTAGDLVTWLQALHGGRVLSPRSYAEMTAPSSLADGTPLRYGMALSVGTDPRGLYRIGHGGGIGGFVSEAVWYPEAELAVVVLINSNGPISPAALASELAATMVKPRARPATRPFAGDAAPLVGRYRGPSRGQEMVVEITHSAEGLMASVNGGPARALPWVDGWTFQQGANTLTFKRAGAAGPATELRVDSGGGLNVLKRQ